MNAAQIRDSERGAREQQAWRGRILESDDGAILLEALGIDSIMTLLAAYLEAPQPRSPRECEHIDKLNAEIARRRGPVCCLATVCGCWA